MREISPAVGCTAEEFYRMADPACRPVVETIRAEKKAGTRKYPGGALIDESAILSDQMRSALVDEVARLTDENLFGRAEMCIQFALLMERALRHLGIPANAIGGQAIYYGAGKEIFRWDHAWVRSGTEIIDANVDSLHENPMVPIEVRVSPFWGPVARIPSDRRLREDRSVALPTDIDVDDIWWPELRQWLQRQG